MFRVATAWRVVCLRTERKKGRKGKKEGRVKRERAKRQLFGKNVEGGRITVRFLGYWLRYIDYCFPERRKMRRRF
jgi:hypothetical protein